MNDRLNFEAESFAVQPEFEGEFQEFAAEQSDAEWAGESGLLTSRGSHDHVLH
jgi:hypothetical protein